MRLGFSLSVFLTSSSLPCMAAYQNFFSICHSCNKEEGEKEGEEEIFITENKSITHKAGKVLFSLGPRAFVQTNQYVAEKLYSTAAEWVKQSGHKRFMELFCGQGAFSFFCAPFIENGLGIEINPAAVEVANLTAEPAEGVSLPEEIDGVPVRVEVVGAIRKR